MGGSQPNSAMIITNEHKPPFQHNDTMDEKLRKVREEIISLIKAHDYEEEIASLLSEVSKLKDEISFIKKTIINAPANESTKDIENYMSFEEVISYAKKEKCDKLTTTEIIGCCVLLGYVTPIGMGYKFTAKADGKIKKIGGASTPIVKKYLFEEKFVKTILINKIKAMRALNDEE